MLKRQVSERQGLEDVVDLRGFSRSRELWYKIDLCLEMLEGPGIEFCFLRVCGVVRQARH